MTKVQMRHQRSKFHGNHLYIMVPLVREYRRKVVQRLMFMAGAM